MHSLFVVVRLSFKSSHSSHSSFERAKEEVGTLLNADTTDIKRERDPGGTMEWKGYPLAQNYYENNALRMFLRNFHWIWDPRNLREARLKKLVSINIFQ